MYTFRTVQVMHDLVCTCGECWPLVSVSTCHLKAVKETIVSHNKNVWREQTTLDSFLCIFQITFQDIKKQELRNEMCNCPSIESNVYIQLCTIVIHQQVSLHQLHPHPSQQLHKWPTFTLLHISYSAKLSREKKFANFEVLWLFMKFESAKFGGVKSLGGTIKWAIRKCFLYENRIFHQFVKVFSLKILLLFSTNVACLAIHDGSLMSAPSSLNFMYFMW